LFVPKVITASGLSDDQFYGAKVVDLLALIDFPFNSAKRILLIELTKQHVIPRHDVDAVAFGHTDDRRRHCLNIHVFAFINHVLGYCFSHFLLNFRYLCLLR
jgi:hypothetical protein